jgi:hypothetical protein
MQPVARQLQHLGYDNGNGGVFYVSLPRSYLEDNWGDLVESPTVKRRLGGAKWPPVICQLSVQI